MLLDYVVLYWQTRWVMIRILNSKFSLGDMGLLLNFALLGWRIVKQDGLCIPIDQPRWFAPIPASIIYGDQTAHHHDIERCKQAFQQACAEEANFSQLAEIPYTREFWIQHLLIILLCWQMGSHGKVDDSCRNRVTSQLKYLSEKLDTKPQYTSRQLAVMS